MQGLAVLPPPLSPFFLHFFFLPLRLTIQSFKRSRMQDLPNERHTELSFRMDLRDLFWYIGSQARQ